MGKLKVSKVGPMATIQDFGRFGFRRYGIPQSGAIDKEWMIAANRFVGNMENAPVVEFAMMGMKLEAVEQTVASVVGADFKVNGLQQKRKSTILEPGDQLEILAPDLVYAYLGIGGRVLAKEDFGSVSTYAMAGFGGIKGRALIADDILESETLDGITSENEIDVLNRTKNPVVIRMMKGPEWDMLKELPSLKTFQVDASSDRMGIRLTGANLDCDYREIASSAVIPGTIQLPADGHPIVLMNDCQTTGGYPRIGKVIEEDMGKLAQVRRATRISLKLI